MHESKQQWRSWSGVLVITVAVVIAMRLFLLTPVVVDGASMLPTFEDGDKVIVSKQSSIDRFDVVVFAVDEQTNYIKRVVGLPGDHIAYEGDQLYINGVEYDEPYLTQFKQNIPLNTTLTENFTLEKYTGYQQIPDGYVFVLGDNRRKSMDSRNPHVGLVRVETIIGEVKLIIYPFVNMQMMNNN